jgi:hypothetical protein
MNRIQALVIAGALTAFAGSASAYVVYDGSFEFPAAPGSDVYDPVTSQGIFEDDAGVDGGAFGYTPVDGRQSGFLQANGAGPAVIQLEVHGLTMGDTYSFSFYDSQRGGYGLLPYTVSVDNTQIYSGAPSSTTPTKVTTNTFVASDTDPDLTFYAADIGGDSDTGIDAIVVNGDGSPTTYGVPTVPEPASWALMLAGVGLAGAAARTRRRAITA